MAGCVSSKSSRADYALHQEVQPLPVRYEVRPQAPRCPCRHWPAHEKDEASHWIGACADWRAKSPLDLEAAKRVDSDGGGRADLLGASTCPSDRCGALRPLRQVAEPDRPHLKCRALLWHAVLPVMVPRLDAAQAVRLNLRAHVAGDAERRHVRLRGPAQVAHGERPTFKLAGLLHRLRGLGDQRCHRRLAQWNASVRAEHRRIGVLGLRKAAADRQHRFVEDRHHVPTWIGVPIPALGVRKRQGCARHVHLLGCQAQQLGGPLATKMSAGHQPVARRTFGCGFQMAPEGVKFRQCQHAVQGLRELRQARQPVGRDVEGRQRLGQRRVQACTHRDAGSRAKVRPTLGGGSPLPGLDQSGEDVTRFLGLDLRGRTRRQIREWSAEMQLEVRQHIVVRLAPLQGTRVDPGIESTVGCSSFVRSASSVFRHCASGTLTPPHPDCRGMRPHSPNPCFPHGGRVGFPSRGSGRPSVRVSIVATASDHRCSVRRAGARDAVSRAAMNDVASATFLATGTRPITTSAHTTHI